VIALIAIFAGLQLVYSGSRSIVAKRAPDSTVRAAPKPGSN
jgi:hypothetical protein